MRAGEVELFPTLFPTDRMVTTSTDNQKPSVVLLCTVLRQARESPDFLRNPELLDHALQAMALVADNTAALVVQQARDAGVDVPEPPCRLRRLRAQGCT